MKKTIATLMLLVSSPALADTYQGLWARSTQLCKTEWIRVNATTITGKDWKCTMVVSKETTEEKVAIAICGYDRTDVIFRDTLKMKINNGRLEVTAENYRVNLVKCGGP